ncbi:Tetratricopeptide-like helical domain superfamily [Sesbania bispinosa]|nr:Tetratricopeptide-like helical domain superfamily [Sesbania bispinosa]
MAWIEDNDGNGREKELVGENGFLKVSEPSVSSSGSVGNVGSAANRSCEGKDDLSYANILRSRNKFVDSLALYERVLESDSGNVEALIGKGICLQMQNMGRLAFDSFTEAIRLDPQNACALTHCGILYKEEGRLMEAAEVPVLDK